MIRKDLIVAVIATFCLTATLFWVVPTRSQYRNDEYNPWVDYDENGKINILDITNVSIAFGTSGTPINKTAILLDLQNRVATLEEEHNYAKTIKFYTPNETVTNQGYDNMTVAAAFTWTLQNSTNNAILGVSVYFQYKLLSTNASFNPVCEVWVDGMPAMVSSFNDTAFGEYHQSTVYPTTGISTGLPNIITHKIESRFYNPVHDWTYVKDINVLLQVMDGLPSEN